MRKIISLSIENPVLVNILMVMIIIIGLFSFLNMPRELVSEVKFNWAMIIIPYPGASSEEVEQLVVIPIEDEIQDVQPGLTGIGSIIFRDEENIIHDSGEDYHAFYKREIAPFKGEVELWYKRRKSFLLDLKIIFVTAWVVLFSDSKIADRMFSDLPKHHIFNS